MYTESFFKKSNCQFIGNKLMWGNHQHWIHSKLFLHNNSNLYTTNNDVYIWSSTVCISLYVDIEILAYTI